MIAPAASAFHVARQSKSPARCYYRSSLIHVLLMRANCLRMGARIAFSPCFLPNAGGVPAAATAPSYLLSRIAQLDQRLPSPDQCLHSAEADVRPQGGSPGLTLSVDFRRGFGATQRVKSAAIPTAKCSISYSNTSSASTSRLCGSVRPSTLAVFRLIAYSNKVGCSIASSPGFAPRRIRAT